MERKIITTADGSTSIHLPELNEQYHSKHGAINEALHVFIKNGLTHFITNNPEKDIAILEIGFGTGLNAFLTFLEALKKNSSIVYHGVEAFPISEEEVLAMNFTNALDTSTCPTVFTKMHENPWEIPTRLSDKFELTKRKQRFETITDNTTFNIIYFDAFGARVQPELWTEAIFERMYNALKTNGILVTYSAKGSVRRAMQACGFMVERLPGPPGKREMLRATKISS